MFKADEEGSWEKALGEHEVSYLHLAESVCVLKVGGGSLIEEGRDRKQHAPSCGPQVSKNTGDRVAGTRRSPQCIASIQ